MKSMSVVGLLQAGTNWDPAADPNVCANKRDALEGNCLEDPILHTCLGERAVQLPPDGHCYNPGALARAWTVRRENPLSRAPFGVADDAAVCALALADELEPWNNVHGGVSDPRTNAVLQRAMDLIRRGAPPDTCDSLTLVLAVSWKRRDLADELLGMNVERRAQPSARDNCALYYAAENGWWETVNAMLRDFRFGPNWADFPMVFSEACATGSEETVTRMLAVAGTEVEASANFNANLRAAAVGGHAGVVDILLRLPPEYGVSPENGHGMEALVEAVREGHALVVRRLMSDRRTPTFAYHGAALVEAALAGRADIARLLLHPASHEAFPADPSADNWRAPLMAAIFGHADVLAELRVNADGARVVRERAPFPLPQAIQDLLPS